MSRRAVWEACCVSAGGALFVALSPVGGGPAHLACVSRIHGREFCKPAPEAPSWVRRELATPAGWAPVAAWSRAVEQAARREARREWGEA